MIKLLLVDDEPIIIRGLKKLVDWGNIGCEIVGEAFDGDKAIKLVNELKPDLVITDLVMPEMDGIDFIKNMKKEGFLTKIIILSGYGEFEYAREALKQDVSDYLLKPVTRETITHSVKKVINEIEKEKNFMKNIDRMREQLRQNMPFLRESFIIDILKGKVKSEGTLRNKAELLDVDISGECFTVIAIELENLYDNDVFKEFNSELLYMFSVRNIVEEVVNNKSKGFVVFYGEIIYILLICEKKGYEVQDIYDMINTLQGYLKKYLGAEISAGIGRKYEDITKVKKSFDESNIALKNKFLIGNGAIIHINDITNENEPVNRYPYKEEQSIIEAIKYNAVNNVDELSERLIESFIKASGNNIDLIYEFCFEFFIQLRRIIRELGMETELLSSIIHGGNKEIRKHKTAQELKVWMRDIVDESYKFIDSMRREKEYDAIREAKDFIQKNYNSNLTLNSVAAKVYLSPTYFSTLFKNKTGENFNEYLTRTRMEAAAKFLKSNKYKMYEISYMVGYKNPRYFSEAFKKYHGVIPSKFI